MNNPIISSSIPKNPLIKNPPKKAKVIANSPNQPAIKKEPNIKINNKIKGKNQNKDELGKKLCICIKIRLQVSSPGYNPKRIHMPSKKAIPTIIS
jgi:hypothetical protein